jgi:murein L,D-transpeptidase YafK
VRAELERGFAAIGARVGDAIYLRLFKHERELELWVRRGERYVLFRTYPICRFSGELGPKLRQGDGQAPEGFYSVGAGQLNPYSQFHLSFDLGYPNAYDRAHGRTGSLLMVHGSCVSIGCYAMGDAQIEQIYTLVAAALHGGQRRVPVHVFPFRFRQPPLPDWRRRRWGEFWTDLQRGYEAFERTRVPPSVRVHNKRYVLQ